MRQPSRPVGPNRPHLTRIGPSVLFGILQDIEGGRAVWLGVAVENRETRGRPLAGKEKAGAGLPVRGKRETPQESASVNIGHPLGPVLAVEGAAVDPLGYEDAGGEDRWIRGSGAKSTVMKKGLITMSSFGVKRTTAAAPRKWEARPCSETPRPHPTPPTTPRMSGISGMEASKEEEGELMP